MSSSPLTSSEKTASENELAREDELDSLDESLDAILSEAQEPAARDALNSMVGDSPAEPPAGEVQMVLAESTVPTHVDDAHVDDDKETPLPVIVDELPSYQAF